MSCEKCEKADEEAINGPAYYYRIGTANIAIVACEEHAKQAIDKLNAEEVK